MPNALSGRFTASALVHFSWPTIVSLVCMSLYTMVDGVFVARCIGTDALSAVNLSWPLVNVFYGLGIMLATGASAIVARQMGEGRGEEARANFSMTLAVAAGSGIILSVAAGLAREPLLTFLGAGPELRDACGEYIGMLLPFMPAAMVQMGMYSFFITAGRPGLGMAATLLGGFTNLVLDYVFIVGLGMGLAGAALATGIGFLVPSLIGLAFFARNRKGALYLVRPRFAWRVLLDSCVNGSSEMVTNLSAAVVIYLFNITMLRHVGVEGVAALTVVLYAEFLISSVNYGYSSGISPVISYQYGRGNRDRLGQVFRNSLLVVAGCSVIAFVLAQLLGGEVVALFAAEGGEVHNLAFRGYRLFSLGFLFMGVNIFASALFTALSNGAVSALLSFVRFLSIAAAILVLPSLVGVEGIWLAVPFAEAVVLVLSLFMIRRYRTVYHYL